jgi:hypothetical protein
MTQIDNMPMPTDDRRICNICNVSKPLNEFSLKVGKNSALRKLFCIKCENAKQKRKKQYGLADNEWNILLSLPCFICGEKSDVVHINGSNPNNSLPLGVLCNRCLKFTTISVGTLEQAANYIALTRDFPFWTRLVIEAETNVRIQSQTPLFDAFSE